MQRARHKKCFQYARSIKFVACAADRVWVRGWGAAGIRKNSFDNWTIDCDWGASQIGPTMDRIAFVYPTNSGATSRAKIDWVKKSNCRAGQSKSGRNKRFAQLRKAQYRETTKKPQESRRVKAQHERSTRGKLTTGMGCVEDEVILPNRIYPIICVTSVSIVLATS